MASFCDRLNVEELSSEVLNATEEHKCDAVTFSFNDVKDVFCAESALALKMKIAPISCIFLSTHAEVVTFLGLISIIESSTLRPCNLS